MKCTRWALGLVGVAGLLLSVTADANAWLFSHCCGHCCNMQITCRQYNAFTPFCSGTVHCDGCCPNFGCAPMNFGCGGCGMPGPVMAAFGGGYPMMAGWGDAPAGMASHMPAMLPPGTPIPTALPMPPNMPLPPGAPMPPGPAVPPASNVPPILNHTAQGGSPGYYYGVQPASYYGYYGYNGYNPYAAYWAAMAPYYGYSYGQQAQPR